MSVIVTSLSVTRKVATARRTRKHMCDVVCVMNLVTGHRIMAPIYQPTHRNRGAHACNSAERSTLGDTHTHTHRHTDTQNTTVSNTKVFYWIRKRKPGLELGSGVQKLAAADATGDLCLRPYVPPRTLRIWSVNKEGYGQKKRDIPT